MRPFLAFAVFASALSVFAQAPVPAASDSNAAIEDFNKKFAAATQAMDNPAVLALWADDGVSLLPSAEPIIGKPAIAAYLDKVITALKGAHMEKFEMDCHAIEVSGDLASEWCTEHQIVTLPNGKPPFDGHGKMLLVLHRNAAGQWLLQREMWNRA